MAFSRPRSRASGLALALREHAAPSGVPRATARAQRTAAAPSRAIRTSPKGPPATWLVTIATASLCSGSHHAPEPP